MSRKVASNCPECATPMEVSVPLCNVMNQLDFSILLYVHSTFDECPGCHRKFVFVIKDVSAVQLGLLEVKENTSRVSAPTPQEMAALRKDSGLKLNITPEMGG